MVAGNGEQRWEGDEGGSGKSQESTSTAPVQSVKLLMAPICVERKSLIRQLMFVRCLYDKHATQVQPHTRVVSAISTLTRLSSHKTFALWTHSRITPESQVSSFESSLSEEQMPGRRQFCRKSATPLRSRKYLGLIHRELAIRTIGYVLVPRGTFVLIISPG